MDANDPATPPPTPQDPPESPQESSPLLLPSLRIENFRGFKELTIPKLGRVNLIVGKNGVGKSSLLEALRIYFTDGAASSFFDTLKTRDEFKAKIEMNDGARSSPIFNVSSLFHGRPDLADSLMPIGIGAINHEDFMTIRYSEKGYAYENFDAHPQRITGLLGIVSEHAPSLQPVLNAPSPRPSLIVEFGGHFVRDIPIFESAALHLFPLEQRSAKLDASTTIPTNGITATFLASLWDKLILTDIENVIVDAVKIISPSVQRIGTIGSESDPGGRRFLARLDSTDDPVPIKVLGDGVMRVLGLAMSLATQRDHSVLIDEFENGLHWSVQPKVWEVVFTLAERLNVQVFATTHSYDCIEAFQQAASRSREPAYLIRLDNRGPELQAVSVTGEELAYITREKIEVR